MTQQPNDDRKAMLWVSSLGALLGGLCCLSPIVMVLTGLATVAVANDIGNWLYGDYKWHFRLAALAFLGLALAVYFRRQGICTLDQARRNRTRIVNASILALTAAVAVYTFWVYVVLHYWGIAAGLPWAQWDESWAIPVSALLFLITALVYRWRRGVARRALSEPRVTSPQRVSG
jgi:hypothetical protein